MNEQKQLNPQADLIFNGMELFIVKDWNIKTGEIDVYEGVYINREGTFVHRMERTTDKGIHKGAYSPSIHTYNESGHVGFSIDGKLLGVHRVLASIFIENPNPLELTQPNHKNGCASDNRIDNLEWSSPSANRKHAYDSGLKPRNISKHLTDDEVREIRSLYDRKNCQQKYLAQKYGVSRTHITNIVNFVFRADVEQPFNTLSNDCKAKYTKKFGKPQTKQLNLFELLEESNCYCF